VPTDAEKISVSSDRTLNVPNRPIVPFIEGDGTGVDVTLPVLSVVNTAVEKAYSGESSIAWMEVFAGEKRLTPIVWMAQHCCLPPNLATLLLAICSCCPNDLQAD